MSKRVIKCPNCETEMVSIEATLYRTLHNLLAFGAGSSILQIRQKEKWFTIMTPNRDARGHYCEQCGSVLLAPSDPKHMESLDQD